MEIPRVHGLQQFAKPEPPLHGSDDQLALLDGDVDGGTGGHSRLEGE
jgi:hypothetical protein